MPDPPAIEPRTDRQLLDDALIHVAGARDPGRGCWAASAVISRFLLLPLVSPAEHSAVREAIERDATSIPASPLGTKRFAGSVARARTELATAVSEADLDRALAAINRLANDSAIDDLIAVLAPRALRSPASWPHAPLLLSLLMRAWGYSRNEAIPVVRLVVAEIVTPQAAGMRPQEPERLPEWPELLSVASAQLGTSPESFVLASAAAFLERFIGGQSSRLAAWNGISAVNVGVGAVQQVEMKAAETPAFLGAAANDLLAPIVAAAAVGCGALFPREAATYYAAATGFLRKLPGFLPDCTPESKSSGEVA